MGLVKQKIAFEHEQNLHIHIILHMRKVIQATVLL